MAERAAHAGRLGLLDGELAGAVAVGLGVNAVLVLEIYSGVVSFTGNLGLQLTAASIRTESFTVIVRSNRIRIYCSRVSHGQTATKAVALLDFNRRSHMNVLASVVAPDALTLGSVLPSVRLERVLMARGA